MDDKIEKAQGVVTMEATKKPWAFSFAHTALPCIWAFGYIIPNYKTSPLPKKKSFQNKQSKGKQNLRNEIIIFTCPYKFKG